jgi:hypothetical protein
MILGTDRAEWRLLARHRKVKLVANDTRDAKGVPKYQSVIQWERCQQRNPAWKFEKDKSVVLLAGKTHPGTSCSGSVYATMGIRVVISRSAFAFCFDTLVPVWLISASACGAMLLRGVEQMTYLSTIMVVLTQYKNTTHNCLPALQAIVKGEWYILVSLVLVVVLMGLGILDTDEEFKEISRPARLGFSICVGALWSAASLVWVFWEKKKQKADVQKLQKQKI